MFGVSFTDKDVHIEVRITSQILVGVIPSRHIKIETGALNTTHKQAKYQIGNALHIWICEF